MSDDPIIERFPLGSQWPTIDPFLFLAHHHDRYPAGNETMGPVESLGQRNIGMDFADIDGWNMYHGSVVPGFPQHPHRGFETITHVRHGIIDHSDSLGATARFSRGDTQWMTAGAGIVHAEMFPLVNRNAPNQLELFQIWLNLPAADKLVDPYFTMFWAEDTPWFTTSDGGEVTVIAGSLPGPSGDPVVALPPPPDSWASKTTADVAIIHVALSDDSSFELPPADAGTRRCLYAFEGSGVALSDPAEPREPSSSLEAGAGAEIVGNRPIVLRSTGDRVECLVLQGRPIAEPVVHHGPFVMNERREIIETFEDYQRTGFGGWPWPSDDPVHERESARFANHADGRTEAKAG